MTIKNFLTDFTIVFTIVLIVNLAVSFLYGYVVHGTQTVAWESAIPVALGLGIALPLVQRREKREGGKEIIL